jgi:uncharacterized Zn finger protein
MAFWSYRDYVPVAQRRAQAAKQVEKLRKKGQLIDPVVIESKKIAQSFWGKAWCDNLERYSDFENRLPRGRTYVRNGSVVDLQIARGTLRALVSGSEVYEVSIDITPTTHKRWKAICKDCAGSIASLVELLKGKLSKNVMERVCREGDGLFPSPQEIKMSCSCPDWADMCKHVAATLYGAGARLDAQPELLFALRGVESADLIASAGADSATSLTGAASKRILADDDVATLFGIEMAPPRAASRSLETRTRSELKAVKTVRNSEAKKGEKPQQWTDAAAMAGDAEKDRAKAKSRHSAGAAQAATPVKAGAVKAATPLEKAKLLKSEPAAAGATTATKPSRRRQKEPAGRTRAAKWIGARARKARG